MKNSFRALSSIFILATASASFAGPVDPPKTILKWKIKKDLIKPANQSAARHAGYENAVDRPVEIPGFVRPGAPLKYEGIILGPNATYDAMFNPAAYVAIDPRDGKEKVFLVPRSEKDQPKKAWKKISEGPLLASEDGRHFYRYTAGPWLAATEPYELAGGTEDARYADLRLQPFVDVDGKSFDAAMMYTAYDGKTARISVMFFNHANPADTRKKGLVFLDEDVMKNPLVPGNPAWNKSMAMRQYRHPKTGEVRNVYFFGEGNLHHGGIMSLASDRPFSSHPDGSFGLKFPSTSPIMKSRKGYFDQGLVESAHQPEVVRLPAALAEKTGESHGLLLAYHGDSPPHGYSVGYAIFSLDHPGGPPLYRSEGPYLKPIAELEKSVQVDKVIFNSAMVKFKGEVLTYSGLGDSYIVVHSAPETRRLPGEPLFTYESCRGIMKSL